MASPSRAAHGASVNSPVELGVGHDDAIVRHIGASLLQGLRRPAETNQLFIDHMMLALTAHIAQAYGGLQRPAASWPAAVLRPGR